MPQVFFNTDTFKPDRFPAMTGKALCDLSLHACKAHDSLGRLISPKHHLYRVPGFFEALRDDFRGWELHHVTGESESRWSLMRHGLYNGRPWWELRFVREDEHRKIHADPDIFLAEYYGM